MGKVYLFFFSLPEDRTVKKKKAPHLTDLNCRLVHVDARFKRENSADRRTDYCHPLAHARWDGCEYY